MGLKKRPDARSQWLDSKSRSVQGKLSAPDPLKICVEKLICMFELFQKVDHMWIDLARPILGASENAVVTNFVHGLLIFFRAF